MELWRAHVPVGRGPAGAGPSTETTAGSPWLQKTWSAGDLARGTHTITAGTGTPSFCAQGASAGMIPG